MKNKIIIFLLLMGCSLLMSTKSYSQITSTVYSNNGDTYDIGTYTETMSYNPPWAHNHHGGFLMDVALKVTNNNIETDPTKVKYKGGMKLHIYAPKVNANKNAYDEPLPVIVYGYGGGFLNPWSAEATLTPKYLAKQGYIVIAPEYRIGINLYDTGLAERAIWRAVQDIRKVIQYARTISSDNYNADASKPLTYVGWSSGGFIGLHNLYLSDVKRPATTQAGYQVTARKLFSLTNFTASTYDLGSIDEPWMGSSPQPAASLANPVQDITVILAGAIGKLDWIDAPINGSLLMIQHVLDAVVPTNTAEAYKGYALFNKDGWQYPEVSGCLSIDDHFSSHPEFVPEFYKYYYMQPGECTNLDVCLPGEAGGDAGPLGIHSWYHDPTNKAQDVVVMDAIVDFIEEAILYEDPNYVRAAAPAEPQLIMPVQLASDDLEDENKLLLVYPNPVKDTFTIKFGELDPSSVEIYDYSGKQILHKNISNDEKFLSLDIRNYTPGMYLVRIHTASGVSVRKIIKE